MTIDKNDIILIAAIGQNNELGKNGDLIWRIPTDLARFKRLTKGHPIIMGWHTFVSISKKPLPLRTNIVMTTHDRGAVDGVLFTHSAEHALAIAQKSVGNEKIFVIGGQKVFDAFMNDATALELTIVDAKCADADTFFPSFADAFVEVSREQSQYENLTFSFVRFRKK